jgi:hypothetical protein
MDGKSKMESWNLTGIAMKISIGFLTRVQGLLKGCKCTKGCKTNACGCKRQGQSCTEGCQCHKCVNLLYSDPQTLGLRGGEEREQNTTDYEEGDGAVEYASDVSCKHK